MKTSSKTHHYLLPGYVDGTLSSTDKQQLEKQLESDALLRVALARLQATDSALRDTFTLEEPSRDFTLNVMAHLERVPVQEPVRSVRKSVMLLVSALLAAAGTALLLATGFFDTPTTTLDVNLFKLPASASKYVPQTIPVSINSRMLLNSIIMINVVVALIVFDRTILKPFFQKRLSQ